MTHMLTRRPRGNDSRRLNREECGATRGEIVYTLTCKIENAYRHPVFERVALLAMELEKNGCLGKVEYESAEFLRIFENRGRGRMLERSLRPLQTFCNRVQREEARDLKDVMEACESLLAVNDEKLLQPLYPIFYNDVDGFREVRNYRDAVTFLDALLAEFWQSPISQSVIDNTEIVPQKGNAPQGEWSVRHGLLLSMQFWKAGLWSATQSISELKRNVEDFNMRADEDFSAVVPDTITTKIDEVFRQTGSRRLAFRIEECDRAEAVAIVETLLGETYIPVPAEAKWKYSILYTYGETECVTFKYQAGSGLAGRTVLLEDMVRDGEALLDEQASVLEMVIVYLRHETLRFHCDIQMMPAVFGRPHPNFSVISRDERTEDFDTELRLRADIRRDLKLKTGKTIRRHAKRSNISRMSVFRVRFLEFLASCSCRTMSARIFNGVRLVVRRSSDARRQEGSRIESSCRVIVGDIQRCLLTDFWVIVDAIREIEREMLDFVIESGKVIHDWATDSNEAAPRERTNASLSREVRRLDALAALPDAVRAARMSAIAAQDEFLRTSTRRMTKSG